MIARCDASSRDDPGNQINDYKRLLELLQPDDEGLYPNLRATGFFEGYSFDGLDATEFKIIGDKIALCLASLDMRSYKAFGFINGDNSRRRYACSVSGKKQTSQHGALPLRNTENLGDRNGGKKCPAEFEISLKYGFIMRKNDHECAVHFPTNQAFRTDSLIIQQSLCHARTTITNQIAAQAENLKKNPGKNRIDLRKEVRDVLAGESSLPGMSENPVDFPRSIVRSVVKKCTLAAADGIKPEDQVKELVRLMKLEPERYTVQVEEDMVGGVRFIKSVSFHDKLLAPPAVTLRAMADLAPASVPYTGQAERPSILSIICTLYICVPE